MVVQQKKLELPYIKIRTDRLMIRVNHQQLYQLKKEEKTSLRMDQTTKLVLKAG
jgi:hypothetical protein